MRRGSTALLLLLLSLAGLRASDQQQVDAPASSDPSQGWVNSVRFFVGVPKRRWYSYLWVDRAVTVRCPVKTFQVYTSSSVHGLQEARDARRFASCGLRHFLYPLSEDCRVSLSPFEDVYVAVEIPPGWLTAEEATPCTFHTEESLTPWRPLCGLGGVALFHNAALLSRSLTFRLCAGTASFVLLSALILAFIVYRHLPSRKLLLTGSMLAASFPMMLQYIAQTWMPGIKDITSNQILITYILITALAGLAVTYYYDNPSNVKLLTILEFAMRGLGLLMLYVQTPAPLLGSTAVILMVGCWLAERMGLSSSFFELALSAALLELRNWRRARWFGKSDMGGEGVEAANEPSPQEGEGPEECSCQTTLLAGAEEQLQPTSSSFAAQRQVLEPPTGMEARAACLGVTKSPLQRRVGLDSYTRLPAHKIDNVSSHQPLTPATSREERTPSAQGQPSLETATMSTAQQSPLVQRGLILNVESGRTIGIGKAKYNQLLSKGYIVDTIGGTLTPPPKR